MGKTGWEVETSYHDRCLCTRTTPKGNGKDDLLRAGRSASKVHRRRGTCSVRFQRGDHVGGTPPPPRWDH